MFNKNLIEENALIILSLFTAKGPNKRVAKSLIKNKLIKLSTFYP